MTAISIHWNVVLNSKGSLRMKNESARENGTRNSLRRRIYQNGKRKTHDPIVYFPMHQSYAENMNGDMATEQMGHVALMAYPV